MKTILSIIGLAAAFFLWIPAANAHSSATFCENAKLQAVSHYQSCLLRTYQKFNRLGREPSDEDFSACDRDFEHRFQRTEAFGTCQTPGGVSPLRERIKAQIRAEADKITQPAACGSLTIALDRATCQLSQSDSTIDLADLEDALSSYGVNDQTVIWIQAWGGDGGFGNNEHAGAGGPGGYAQITTTVGAIRDAHNGTSVLHYYLGRTGSNDTASGGDSGTATLVTVSDLTSSQLRIADSLLIAGGGGGGGAGRGKEGSCGTGDIVTGYHGGGAAWAISTFNGTQDDVFASGGDGEGRTGGGPDASGQGGGSGGNGGAPGKDGSAQSGDDAIAPIGGIGGGHADPQIGFFNQPGTLVTRHGGGGGGPGDDAGGGGGGGGYSGGGGGAQGTAKTDCTAGGGGGASSFAVASTAICSAAPTSKPPNPNGKSGFVQIVVDLGACE